MSNYVFPNVPGDDLKAGDIITFNYTGSVQTLDTKKINMGKIKIECYGAGSQDAGGGYAYGIANYVDIRRMTSHLYFVVGQYNPSGGAGWDQVSFGGGGACDGGRGNAGGASDIRTYYNPEDKDSVEPRRSLAIDKGTLNEKSLKSRIIVAGGAGAADTNGKKSGPGAAGGGWVGDSSNNAGGGTQTHGAPRNNGGSYGGLGYGGTAWSATGAGGGGLYGGAGNDGGGGGSSYVSGNPACPFITSSGITFDESGTQTGINRGYGKIVITLIGAPPSNRVLYYQKKGKSPVNITLYKYLPLNLPDGCLPLRLNENEFALAIDKNMTLKIDEKTSGTPTTNDVHGNSVGKFLIASYSFTSKIEGTFVLKTKIIWNGVYNGAPRDWWESSMYATINDEDPRLDYVYPVAPYKRVGYTQENGEAYATAYINDIHEYAYKNGCGDTYCVIMNIPLTFVAGETKNINLYNVQHSSSKDSTHTIYQKPLCVTLGGKYSDSELEFTNLTINRNNKDYLIIKDCLGGAF